MLSACYRSLLQGLNYKEKITHTVLFIIYTFPAGGKEPI